MTELSSGTCEPCQGGVPPLSTARVTALVARLDVGGTVVDEHHLSKVYPFENFVDGLAFTNRIGDAVA